MPTLFSDFLVSCLAFMQRALAVGFEMKRVNVINEWIRELPYDERADKYEQIDQYLQSEQQLNTVSERINYNKIICNILNIINGIVEEERDNELAGGDAPLIANIFPLPDHQLLRTPEPENIRSQNTSPSHTNNNGNRSKLRRPMTLRRWKNTQKGEMITPVSNGVKSSSEITPSGLCSKLKQPTSYVRKTENKPTQSTQSRTNTSDRLQMMELRKKLFPDVGAACLPKTNKNGSENESKKLSSITSSSSVDTSPYHTNNIISKLQQPMSSQRSRNTQKCEMISLKTKNKPTHSPSSHVNARDGTGILSSTIGSPNKLSRDVKVVPNVKKSKGRKREVNTGKKIDKSLTNSQVESLLIRRHRIAPRDNVIRCNACNDVIVDKVAMLACGHQMDRKCVEGRVKESAECFLCRCVV